MGLKPPYSDFADELRRRCPEDFENPQVQAEKSEEAFLNARDELIEANRIEFLERECRETLAMIAREREDMIG